jgi:uncharacterized protein
MKKLIILFLLFICMVPFSYAQNFQDMSFEELYKKAAEENSPEAQFYLGVRYVQGDSVEKDAQKAIEWYEKASAQGVTEAAMNIVSLYYSGDGVEKDYRKVFEYYQKVTDKDPEAQFVLSFMYSPW